MIYTYGANMELDEEDGCWYVDFPAFPGELEAGDTVEDVVLGASELLYLLIAERIDEGLPLPDAVLDPLPNLVVSVDVTDEGILATRCMTVTQAAEELGITPSRVSQLLTSGQLEAYTYGEKRMVTIASVNERKANRPPAHRPRKAEKTAIL